MIYSEMSRGELIAIAGVRDARIAELEGAAVAPAVQGEPVGAMNLAYELGGLEDGSYHLEVDELERVIHAARQAVQREPVAWLAECMRSDFKKPLQALHLSPMLADDTCRHWKSRGCDVSQLPLYTTLQPAEQQPKCMTCSDSGIVGHSMLCPACGPESTGRQQPAPDVAGVLERIDRELRPRSMCRDCADGNGRCDSGELCDPHQRADELMGLLRSSLAAPDDTQLVEALKSLVKGYVNLLEAGKDRITSLGGDCDPVPVMEHNDPWLRDARVALAPYRKGDDA